MECPHIDCGAEMQAHGLERHLKYSCASSFVKYRVWLIETARRKRDYPRPWGADVQIASADAAINSSIDTVNDNEKEEEERGTLLVDDGGNTDDDDGSDYSAEEGEMFMRPH